MPHSHDYGYKDLFSHPHILKELLFSFVTEPWVTELDFSHATLIDKSFITPSKKKLESDLIWRIPLNSGPDIYLYILIEFQSTVDHFMALRMLRYILELYGTLLKAKPKIQILPPVFPILLYNGDARWSAPENIADLIDQRISLDFLPRFRYFKIAENEFSRDKLLSLKNLIGALFLVETTDREELVSVVAQIVAILEQEQPEVYKAFLQWLYSFFSEPAPQWVTEISQLKEVPTMLATTLKKWEHDLVQQGLQQGLQQGIQKGLQQGLFKGKQEEKRETARKLKQKGMSIHEIAELTGLSIDEVQKL
ncbi:MAG: Rpn family recombination-promoting nuclease/putative transposase [Spirochaetota bacterium]|jgi:predicted transposase/invertase (TIGR01784 family)